MSDEQIAPDRFADCPRTTKAMRKGAECKANHLYTTADFSDELEREVNSLRTQLREAREQVARLTGERDEARARVEAEIERGKSWCSDFIAMRKDRDAIAGQRDALCKTGREYAEIITTIRAELSQAQADLAEAQRQLSELQNPNP